MREFLKTVYLLDAGEDVQELVAYVQRTPVDHDELHATLVSLLTAGRIRPAYILAMLLANRAILNPAICAGLCAGGLLFGNRFEWERGAGWLAAHMAGQTDGQRLDLFNRILVPVMAQLQRTPVGDARILELAAAVFPWLASRFDPHALPTVPPRSHEPLPLSPPCPPQRRQPRRVLVPTRARVLPKSLWPAYPWDSSRPDMRPHLNAERRLTTAMRQRGWEVRDLALNAYDRTEDCRAILQACLSDPADLLIVDESFAISKERSHEACRIFQETVALLRRMHPSLKVVMTLLDPEFLPDGILQQTAPLIDAFWGLTDPDRALTGKVLPLPLPRGAAPVAPAAPLEATMWLEGFLTGHRRLWQSAARTAHLSIRPGPAPLPACQLHLAAHPRYPDPATDGDFAALLDGALLVREGKSTLSRYFVHGEHYLEFSSLAELTAIADLLARAPDQVEAIRRAGHAYACEQYGDVRLLDHLEGMLYGDAVPQAPIDLELPNRLVAYEHLSVWRWCRPAASAAELLTGPGNLIRPFPPAHDAQPPLDLGLCVRGEGYEDLFPIHDEQVAAFIDFFDFRVRATAPLPRFVARLTDARIEFPGFGVFLERHLLMEESYHHQRRTEETTTWFAQASKRRMTRLEVPLELNAGFGFPVEFLRMPLDVNYYLHGGEDQYIEGPALMLSGPSWANWHHWFIEMLPRLWAVEAMPELADIPLILRAPLLPFQLETLQALGIDPGRIRLFSGKLLRVGTLLFPSVISPENYAAINVAWLRQRLLPAFGIDTTRPATELLFLSRERMEGRPPRMVNEDAVVAMLTARGFRVVYPEQMSVGEQLALFNSARVIVAPFGSGGTNIVFSQPGATLIELMSPSFPQFINMYYTSLNSCHYGCLMSAIVDGMEMIVDVDALARVVDRVLR
ncbi:MAG: DUF563 domain-containing protein [Magnetococcales bacterium]|nr:DUF563 domain-containing protein [Magnetococcales bacterium]